MHTMEAFTPRLEIGVMASGKGTNFEALVNTYRSYDLNINISILIVNKANCEAINRAKQLSIPYLILDHKDFDTREDHEEEIIKALSKYNVELIVMAGWMRIVTSKFIDTYEGRLVNIHPSLLPSFKGMNAVEQALKAKVYISGCSVHLVNSRVDSGPILIQAAVPVLDNDNNSSLLVRIQEQEHRILPIGVYLAAKRLRLK